MNEPTTAEIKENIKNSGVWVRLLFMLLFVVFYSAAEIVLLAVVLYQFLSLLVAGQKNDKILAFGSQLASYTYQVFSYLTFNTERKPFPMADWPSAKPLVETDEVDVCGVEDNVEVESEPESTERQAMLESDAPVEEAARAGDDGIAAKPSSDKSQ